MLKKKKHYNKSDVFFLYSLYFSSRFYRAAGINSKLDPSFLSFVNFFSYYIKFGYIVFYYNST